MTQLTYILIVRLDRVPRACWAICLNEDDRVTAAPHCFAGEDRRRKAPSRSRMQGFDRFKALEQEGNVGISIWGGCEILAAELADNEPGRDGARE